MSGLCPVMDVEGQGTVHRGKGEEQVCGRGDTRAERQIRPHLAESRVSWCLVLGAEWVVSGVPRKATARASPSQLGRLITWPGHLQLSNNLEKGSKSRPSASAWGGHYL